MQKRQAREQIVHERLRPVWFVGVAPCASPQAGKVYGIPKVNALVWFPAVKKSERGFSRFGVDV